MGGGGSKVDYQASPEQRQIWEGLLPGFQSIYGTPGTTTPGTEGYYQNVGNQENERQEWVPGTPGTTTPGTPGTIGGPTWNVPQAPGAPTAPSMQGTLSGISPYPIQGYNIPQQQRTGYGTPGAPLPTQGLYDSLDPSVKAGILAPFKQGEQQLMETLGAGGQLGSARGGFSGAGAAGLGSYWADAAPQMAMTGWNMMQPGLMAEYQGQLGANQYMAQQQNQMSGNQWGAQLGQNQQMADLQNLQLAQQQDWQAQERMTDYQNLFNQGQQNYQTGLQQWQAEQQSIAFPYTVLPGLLGGTYSNPMVSQQGMSPVAGAASGAAAGTMAMGWPYGTIGGGVLGLMGTM